MKIYTKETLIEALRAIRELGWVESARQGNAGGVGNTLEDLLEIEENNLPLPNASEWELKCQRTDSGSLTTLFHLEPSPRGMRFVPAILLPSYGWPHDSAGKRYPPAEMSFRQTINAACRTDRGFGIDVNRGDQRIEVSFDASAVSPRHREWLESVRSRVGLEELKPKPYWGFQDLYHKAGNKLPNCFYILAQRKRESGREYFRYNEIKMLQHFALERFIKAIEQARILVDFDARTGHNHGTKFRLRKDSFSLLYASVTII